MMAALAAAAASQACSTVLGCIRLAMMAGLTPASARHATTAQRSDINGKSCQHAAFA